MKHILLCLALAGVAFVASCKKSEEAPKTEAAQPAEAPAKPAEAPAETPEAKK
jgi:hypothetical protein